MSAGRRTIAACHGLVPSCNGRAGKFSFNSLFSWLGISSDAGVNPISISAVRVDQFARSGVNFNPGVRGTGQWNRLTEP